MPNGLLNRLSHPGVQRALVPKGSRAYAPRTSRASTGSSSRSTECAAGTAIYGSRGFLQYQFVVPYGAEHVVRAGTRTLERGRAHRRSSRSSSGSSTGSRSMIGFPIEGWTLALDIPTSAQARRTARRSRRAGRGGRRTRVPHQGLPAAPGAARGDVPAARLSGARPARRWTPITSCAATWSAGST